MLPIQKDLRQLADPKKAAFVARYFKTGKGEYGEGDIFLGLTVPQTRSIAKKYSNLSLLDIQKLLDSKIHEMRQAGLMILCYQFLRTVEKEKIYNFYISNISRINNWDLIDGSAPVIVGGYLIDKPKEILYTLAKSKNMWERRIAILATQAFIRNDEFHETLKIAEMLLHDEHDLLHKAVGWMLREIGNKDRKAEELFLQKHYKIMPRTMLRYAIEKFPPNKKLFYMKK